MEVFVAKWNVRNVFNVYLINQSIAYKNLNTLASFQAKHFVL